MLTLLKKLCSGYYNFLLVTVVLLFIFRPYGQDFFYLAIWKFLLTCVFLSVIFNSKHSRWVGVMISTLVVPMIILSWFDPGEHQRVLFITNNVMTIVFLAISTCSIIYDVVRRPAVSTETMRGLICAFFVASFTFAYTYYLIAYLSPPGAFALTNRPDLTASSVTDFLSEMLYFSFVVILTVGFGDITPVKDIAQTVMVLEAIFGQFYIAILVSRLVSTYAYRAQMNQNELNAKKHLENISNT